MGKIFKLERKQFFAATKSEVWNFFSRPQNLAQITPPDMNFRILTVSHTDQMYPGQVIEYKVCPVPGISVYWMTEITQVKEGRLFIDEQRVGPYKMWHHQHHFSAVAGGVEMTDIVHYQLPLGWLGTMAHGIFVQKRLQQIFDYRYKKGEELFTQRPITTGVLL